MKALVYDVNGLRWLLCRAAGFLSPRAFYGPLAPLKLVDCPVPDLPGPEWVRLRTILGGICGTDLALIAQRVHPGSMLNVCASFPAGLGHENVAIVDKTGPAVLDWQPGQRVCVEPALGCAARGLNPPCTECAAGRTSLCLCPGDARFPARALVGLNRQTGGSWAEYFVAHQSQLFAVPENLTDDEAVLVDPLASATHAVLRRPPLPGESVLINGAGIIALGIVSAIRALGHDNPLTVIARHVFQAELVRAAAPSRVDVLMMPRGMSKADRYDAIARHTGGCRLSGRFGNQMLVGGFDLTFDCTGTGIGLGDALKWTRPRGTLVAIGTSGITLLETTPIWFDELTLIGANGRQVETLGDRRSHSYLLVMEWLRDGRLNGDAFPVSRYRLSEYSRAFRELLAPGKRGIVKAAFEP